MDFADCDGRYAIPPASNSVAASWSCIQSDVLHAGGENFLMNLWQYNPASTTDGQGEEIIISRFVFVPDPIPATHTTLPLHRNPAALTLADLP